MTGRFGVPLHDDEERYAIIRASFASYLPRFIFGTAWALAPFIFFFPLLRLAWTGVAFVILLALSGVLYLLNLRASWFGSGLVVTNKRCVDVTRKGVGAPLITEVAWSDVAEVKKVPGSIWQRLCGLGTIRVDLRSPSPFSFALSGVRKPELVARLLTEVQYMRTKPRL